MNILVVKLSSMGDIVFALPCFRALRECWPEARIVAAVNQEFAALLEESSAVDELLVRRGTERIRRLKTLRQAAWSGLRNRFPRFDLAIDLQGNFHSAAWTYCSGARRIVGLGGRRPGWAFSLQPDFLRHAIDQNAAVLEALGVPVTNRVPVLSASSHDDAFVVDLLRRRGLPERDFLVVHPFTAWRSKEWPLARYASVLRALTRPPGSKLTALVTGSGAEAAAAAGLCDAVASPSVVSLAGTLTLGQSLALWSRAALFLGGDTGALHASAALGVRTVALFGPTLPEVTGPVGAGRRIVQASRPAAHDEYRSPDGGRHMAAIPEQMVLDALRDLLPDGIEGSRRLAHP